MLTLNSGVTALDRGHQSILSLAVAIVTLACGSVVQAQVRASVPPFRGFADQARRELKAQWPTLPTLSDEDEAARQTALATFRDGYGTEAYEALVTLTRNGEHFLRNCTDLLNILREKGRVDPPRSGPFGAYKCIALRLPATSEGLFKQAVVETIFAFYREAALPEEEADKFLSAIFTALYRYREEIPLVPEYGDWILIAERAVHLESADEWTRRRAESDLYRIATIDSRKYDGIVALFDAKIPGGGIVFSEPLAEHAPDPDRAGIPAADIERLMRLSSEDLSRELEGWDRSQAFKEWLAKSFTVPKVPVDFTARLRDFLHRPNGIVFLESYVREHFSKSDLPELHALLGDEGAGNDWHGIIFAVAVLEDDAVAFETVKEFVSTPRKWTDPGYFAQVASAKNREVVMAIRNLAMIDPNLSGPFLREAFSLDGARRFLHRWGEPPLPQGVTLERPLIRDFLAGVADAMLHSQSRELYRKVEQTYEALASKAKEERTELDYEFLSVCRENMAVRDLYLDMGWDAGVSYLCNMDDWEAQMNLISIYSLAYIPKAE